LMYYRARTYDPETGRFMQRDPLEYINGINFYLYVLSNPLNNSDPLGLMSMRIRPAPPKRTRPTHSSHVGDDWPSRGIYEADICEKGCYAHCYEMVTEYNYTGALVGHELTARGLTMEVIKAILEGIAKGTGGGLSPGARYAFPVIFEKRVSSHEYFHIDCKKNEIYRERRFTETTYNSDVDQTFTFTPVYGKVSRGDLDIFRTIIEKKKPQVSYDRWSTDGSVWHGAKLDYIESYCTTNNTKDYEFPSEYFPGPGYELVNMKPEEYYKPK
ncbi:MAG: RHS repeat-associated core domain-containing protein, partial [Lentisphaerae bacterium]|nr:RHS repeat-associated core domain-containing protein [Lentisphaerota bacterium]